MKEINPEDTTRVYVDESPNAHGHHDQEIRHNAPASPIETQGHKAKHANVLCHSTCSIRV